MQGWIKLHRKLLEWEWYSKPVVKSIFIHSLLRANHKDGKWQGKDVKRGSYISSVDKLIKELGHTRQEIRTALKHLKSTNELTTISGTQHTVFIVVNYDNYQDENSDLTNEQPTANQRATTNKNEKNEKKKDNIDWDDLKNHFNSLMPNKKVASISDKRKKHIRSMLKSTGRDIDTLKASIEYAATTENGYWPSHRNGNTDHTGKFWPPKDFDFYMREATFLKTIED